MSPDSPDGAARATPPDSPDAAARATHADSPDAAARLARAEGRRLRAFGLTVGGALIVLAAFLLWKQRPAWPYAGGLGALGILLGLALPRWLRPVERVWMKVARVMGWVMTRVILTLVFFLVFTPIGLGMRLFGRDPLSLSIDRRAASYWIPRAAGKRPPESMERMF